MAEEGGGDGRLSLHAPNTIGARRRSSRTPSTMVIEWTNKPVSFVGYGGIGGTAVEQLRPNAIELQMAPIRVAVHIQPPVYIAVVKEGKPLERLRLPQPGGRRHARPAGLVGRRAEGRARAAQASGRLGILRKKACPERDHKRVHARLPTR